MHERKFTFTDSRKRIIDSYRSRLKIREENTFSKELNTLDAYRRQHALSLLVSYYEKVAQNDLLHQSAQTDEIEDLHWLMSQPAWMRAHIVNTGQYGDFLRDVQLAWNVADKAAPFRPEMVGRQVRYALLQTSINSLASNIRPATLMLGLQTGLWDEKTALTYAYQVAHGMTKVTMLTEIGAFLREQHRDELAQEVFLDTLIAMREIDHAADFVQALVTVAQYLPPALMSDALGMAQEIPRREDRARVLSALAPHLSSDLMEEALEVIRQIGASEGRAIALRGLAPYLLLQAPHLLSQMLQMVQDLYGGVNQADVLIALAAHVPSHARAEILNIAQTIYDPCYRAAVLLAFRLYEDPEEQLAIARNGLLVAGNDHNIEDRAKGIALLAPNLPEELLPEALAIVRTIGHKATEALVALAPRLSDELQAEVIAEVQKWNSFFFINRSEVLVALIPHLSPLLFPTMLEAAHSIIQEVYASEEMAHIYPEDLVPRVLVALFPSLPRELMSDALVIVEDIQAERSRGYALAQLAPYLPEELVPKALDLVRKLKAVYRAAALTAFGEHGFPSLLDEALRSAQYIQEADESTTILPVLLAANVSVFPPEMHFSIIDEALKIAREIDNVRHRTEVLLALAPSLPLERCSAVVQEALSAAYTLQEPKEQFPILSHLLTLLPPEQWPEVVDKALQAVQKDFSKDKQARAIAHVSALSDLAPFLSQEQREEAVVAARKLRHLKVRSLSLAALAPYFPPAQRSLLLSKALKAARRISDEERGDRFEALAVIAMHLPTQQRSDVLAEALTAAKKVGTMYRLELGSILAGLFADLPSDLLPSAVTLARQIGSPQALTALIPCVPPEEQSNLLDDALTAIRQVASGIDRAHLLAKLIPFVVPDRQLSLLEEALRAMQQFDLPVKWSNFSQVLWSLASWWAQLPRSQAYALWVKESLWGKKSVLHAYAQYRRSYFLAALSGLLQVIVALGGQSALTESMNAVLEICCQWSWSYRRV